jgi:uncharacterized DUF497 family protein
MIFEWDPSKATANLRTHGVSFEEAVTAFADAMSLTIGDPDHSNHEIRLILLGYSAVGRLLTVSHTERGQTIRLISARIASRHERQDYEQEPRL